MRGSARCELYGNFHNRFQQMFSTMLRSIPADSCTYLPVFEGRCFWDRRLEICEPGRGPERGQKRASFVNLPEALAAWRRLGLPGGDQ